MKNLTIVLISLLLFGFLLPHNIQAKGIREERNREQGKINALSDGLHSLKDAYSDYFLMGNIISPRDLDTERFLTLQKHFNIVTAENHMKPDFLQREKGVFTFEAVSNMVDAALEAGMKMHGHTLAWHAQSPGWMNYDGISRNEAIENMVNHVQTVVSHFKGRIISWDVLNEAFIDDPPNPHDWRASLRQTPWLRAIGPEYIEILFRTARESDPDAVLYYNDYAMDNQKKSLAVYNMIKELNEANMVLEGKPLIDAIGMQGHYRITTNIDNVAASLERFSSLGIEISITELDVLAGAN